MYTAMLCHSSPRGSTATLYSLTIPRYTMPLHGSPRERATVAMGWPVCYPTIPRHAMPQFSKENAQYFDTKGKCHWHLKELPQVAACGAA